MAQAAHLKSRGVGEVEASAAFSRSGMRLSSSMSAGWRRNLKVISMARA